jgi:hypothetical protein
MDVDRSFHLCRWPGVEGHQRHTSKHTWYLTKAKEAAAMLAIHQFGDDPPRRAVPRHRLSARLDDQALGGTRGR